MLRRAVFLTPLLVNPLHSQKHHIPGMCMLGAGWDHLGNPRAGQRNTAIASHPDHTLITELLHTGAGRLSTKRLEHTGHT